MKWIVLIEAVLTVVFFVAAYAVEHNGHSRDALLWLVLGGICFAALAVTLAGWGLYTWLT